MLSGVATAIPCAVVERAAATLLIADYELFPRRKIPATILSLQWTFILSFMISEIMGECG